MNLWDSLTKIRMAPDIEIVRPFILLVKGREFTSADHYSAPKLECLWLEWVECLDDIDTAYQPRPSAFQTPERWMDLSHIIAPWGAIITHRAVCGRIPNGKVESHKLRYGYLWCMVPEPAPICPKCHRHYHACNTCWVPHDDCHCSEYTTPIRSDGTAVMPDGRVVKVDPTTRKVP
jgi:hypothetical protein